MAALTVAFNCLILSLAMSNSPQMVAESSTAKIGLELAFVFEKLVESASMLLRKMQVLRLYASHLQYPRHNGSAQTLVG
jgi:hypothetical protein